MSISIYKNILKNGYNWVCPQCKKIIRFSRKEITERLSNSEKWKDSDIKIDKHICNSDIRLLGRADNGGFLNLGCGKKVLPHFDNIDQFQYKDYDIKVINLFNDTWNLKSDTYSFIFSSHFFEHIPRGQAWWNVCNELFRVAKDNAIIEIRCPYPNYKTLIDCDHRRLIDAGTFKPMMRTKTYGLGITQFTGNGYIELIYREAKGNYHFKKYLNINVAPYWCIVLGFRVIKKNISRK